ncbi:hypothetical protein [Actinoplanes sp. NPDC051859]|uniref:hypothetical protein n=1 Tax=Actinoplanes sp. NPDC051859 TaxID=3363909 RepID=UPI0037B93AA9
MSWRDNPLALDALAVQGYYEEDNRVLKQDTLAASLRDIYAERPVLTSGDDVLLKKAQLGQLGLTSEALINRVLPGFLTRTRLREDEATVLKREPKEHPDLEERAKAVADVTALLWGTMSRTSRSGAVQTLLVHKGLLLVEAKVTRDGVTIPVKVATNDQDLIIEYYVRPRGDQIVRVSGTVRDDCAMVGMTFEGIAERMKRELGISVTTAVGRLMQVATPDFAVLTGPDPVKAISSTATRK